MLRVVISGVNLVQGGILSVLKDALKSIVPLKADHDLHITVLVHDKSRVHDYLNDCEVLEFPAIKSSWFKRLYFEYVYCHGLSRKLKPDLWISLHDITPNVVCPIQVVYCHNPSPFYKLDVKRFFYDVTFFMFCLFYKYLYQINIKRNAFVIVQQQWIRESFKKMYGVKALVAHPVLTHADKPIKSASLDQLGIDFNKYVFLYPAVPRIFKNFEVILMSVKELQNQNLNFEVVITMNGTENTYAKKIFKKYNGLKTVKFIGLQDRDVIDELYKEVNCLVFPSRLETWGLPVSEFKHYNKPIIIADMPYAHETIGAYPLVKFFDPLNYKSLAAYMELAINGSLIFDKNIVSDPEDPFFTNWNDLLIFLLNSSKKSKTQL